MQRLIDANALLNDLKASAKDAREWKEETQDEEIKIRAEQTFGTFVECALRVKNAPTIEPEVRHGRWKTKVIHDAYCFQCSACNSIYNGDTHYCPHCGAKMGADHIADDSKKVGGDDNG